MDNKAAAIRRVKALKKALDDMGFWTDLEIHNFGEFTDVNLRVNWPNKPQQQPQGKPARLTQAQRAMLGTLKREGSLSLPLQHNDRSIKSLLKRGLISETYSGPLPGNDYGGTLDYTLTPAGREVAR